MLGATACGEPIPNEGEKDVPMRTEDGDTAMMKVQIADVDKILGAARRFCEAGNRVVFDEDGSYILNKATRKITKIHKVKGRYVLKVWVPKTSGGVNAVAGVSEGAKKAMVAMKEWEKKREAGFQRLADLI